MFEELEKFLCGVPKAVYQCRTALGENALNLAVRARLMLYVEKYINRDDDFFIIRQVDKSGRNSIQWCRYMLEHADEGHVDEFNEIYEFLTDHDPGVEDEESEDDGSDDISDEVRRYEKTFGKASFCFNEPPFPFLPKTRQPCSVLG